jgi:hypothetical protein
MTRAELITAGAAAGYPDPAAFGTVFDATNNNEDAYICVLVQRLPNDASGFTMFFVITTTSPLIADALVQVPPASSPHSR